MVAQAEQQNERQGQGHAVADELMADPIVRREPYVMQDPLMDDLPARRDSQIRRAPQGSGLYDVLDLILDKGIVIDAFVRVSLVGIELLTVDLRVVIASVDTYLRYAEGVEKLQVYERSRAMKLQDMVKGSTKSMAKEGAKGIGEAITGQDDDEDEGGSKKNDEEGEENEGVVGSLAKGVRNVVARGVGSLVGSLTGGGDEDDDEGGDGGERKQQPQRRRTQRASGGAHNGRGGGGGGGRSTGRTAGGARRPNRPTRARRK